MHYFRKKFVDILSNIDAFVSGFQASKNFLIISLVVSADDRQHINNRSENNSFWKTETSRDRKTKMTKAIAQNISLFSFNDAFKIRGDDRVEAAKGGVFATTTMLTRRDVSCPKGSTIKIRSNDLTGEEIENLVSFAGYRQGITITDSSYSEPKTELDSYRDVAICHLNRGELKMASAYAKLMTATEQVKAAREDLQELITAAA
jgi:hypothetical protein